MLRNTSSVCEDALAETLRELLPSRENMRSDAGETERLPVFGAWSHRRRTCQRENRFFGLAAESMGSERYPVESWMVSGKNFTAAQEPAPACVRGGKAASRSKGAYI